MDFKPNEFFLGVIDLFAVVLPGTIAAFLFDDTIAKWGWQLGLRIPPDGAMRWLAFIVTAYVLGHVIFLLGAYLDRVYEYVRGVEEPFEGMSKVSQADPKKAAKAVARQAKREKKDELFRKAKAVRSKYLPGLERPNPFKFAKALLSAESPALVSDIARLEADSKFFRSLAVVVLLFLAVKWPLLWAAALKEGSMALAAPVAVLVLFLARYCERRHKSAELAFAYLITYDMLRESKESAKRRAGA